MTQSGSSDSSPSPRLAVTPAGGCSCASVLWRTQGQLHASVIVKATFDIVPEGPMTLAAAEPVTLAEAHYDGNPMRSVRMSSDTAPYKPRADVLLVGHACAPQGTEAPELSVRLALFRGRALLDKVIVARGDDGGARPFARLPLVYERAFGGPGSEPNPLGTGVSSKDKAPNLVDPADPRRVACFAPIGRGWPERRKLLGGTPRRALEAAIAEIPVGLDLAYYQASPDDQRVDYLQGDEWVILEGVHPAMPRIRSCLPRVRALARIHGLPSLAGAPPAALAGDTLIIDADAMRCSVVWRRSFPVPDEASLAAMYAVVGVELPGHEIAWSTPPSRAAPAPPPPKAIEVNDSTQFLDDAPAPAPAPRGRRVPTSPFEGTMEVTAEDAIAAAQRASAPFKRASAPPPPPRASAPPPPRKRDEHPHERTRDIEAESPSLGKTLPFGKRGASARSPAAPEAQAPSEPRPAALPPSPIAAPPVVERARDAAPEPDAWAPAAAKAAARKPSPTGMLVVHDASLSLGVVPWGDALRRDCVTVVAKATCDLVVGGPATIRAGDAGLCDDVMREDASPGTLARPSERAPYKVRSDVVLLGQAHAGGAPVKSMRVGFRFGDPDAEGQSGFDRTIEVFGDRRWERGLAAQRPSEPAPFMQMPLVYERAYGGKGWDDNPIGLGHDTPMRRPGPQPLPNLEDPGRRLRTPRQRVAPACFAPVPLAWKARFARAGRKRATWASLSEALDWTYYQVAPPSQQLAWLRGDETFAITGMHPEHATIEGALPGVRPRCFASVPAGVIEIVLRLDTVVIDADALAMTLVWRGTVPVADERAPEIATLCLLTEAVAEEPMTLEAGQAAVARAEAEARG